MSEGALRAAIIGCGAIANAHGNAAAALRDRIGIVACADVVPESARRFGERFGCSGVYTDHRLMIERERPDLVIVCTWPALHEEQVLDAIARGVPAILCEKSLAMSAASAARMAAAAEAGGAVLVESYMGRHHPRMLELQRRFQDGEIGRLRTIRATFQRNAIGERKKNDPRYGGVPFDFTCYCVNALAAFMTELPLRIHGEWRRGDDGLVIALHGLVAYGDGTIATVASSYEGSFEQTLELHGDAGILRMDQAWIGDGSTGIELIPDGKPPLRLQTPVVRREECQLAHLCDCIRDGRTPRMAIGESVRNHAVLDALLESARTGSCVQPRLDAVAAQSLR